MFFSLRILGLSNIEGEGLWYGGISDRVSNPFFDVIFSLNKHETTFR